MQISVWQQREVASALDRGIDLALVMRLGSGQACWHDFAVFLNEVLQSVNVLVIYLLNTGGSKAAEFLALEQRVLLLTLLLELALVEFLTECHVWLLYLVIWCKCLEIRDVENEVFAIAAFTRQESGEPKYHSQFHLIESSRNFTRSYGGNFKLNLAWEACFNLFRMVRQLRSHNRNTGRRVSQYVALGNGSY